MRRGWLTVWMTLLFVGLEIAACRPVSAPLSTPVPTFDVAAVQTAAAATVIAGMTKTAQAPTRVPTTEPTPTATPLPPPTATRPLPPSPTATIEPTATLKPTVTSAPIAILVTLDHYNYEQWGRPAGMVDPSKSCGDFDDSHPVRKLTAYLRIENRSSKDMTDWYFSVFKTNGAQAYVCFYGYQGSQPFPDVPAGQVREVTFAAFMEPNERASYGVVEDSRVGKSTRVTLPRQ